DRAGDGAGNVCDDHRVTGGIGGLHRGETKRGRGGAGDIAAVVENSIVLEPLITERRGSGSCDSEADIRAGKHRERGGRDGNAGRHRSRIHGEQGGLTGGRAHHVADSYLVLLAGVCDLDIGNRKRGSEAAGDARAVNEVGAIPQPLITERGGSRGGDGETGVCGGDQSLALWLGENGRTGRPFAFSGRPGVVNRSDLRGRERAIVEGDLIQPAGEFVIPEGLAGSAEEEGERAVILREGDVALAYRLSVDVELDEIRATNRRQVVPGIDGNVGGR